MSLQRLTDRFIQGIKSPKMGRLEFSDALVPGLSLRVTQSGKKSWSLMYRSHVERDKSGYGKQRRLTMGRYPMLSLELARKRADEILLKIESGDDPREKQAIGTPVTVADGVLRYIEEHVKVRNKPRRRADGTNYWEREQFLKRLVIANLGGKPIQAVTRKDVMAMHRKVAKDAGATAADRAAEALRAAFNWLEDTELVDGVPNIRLAKRTARAATSRHRVLSDPEIKAIWSNLDDGVFGTIVRLLLMTGQRRSEVAQLRWSEIDDGDVWEIPAPRTKNGLPHRVPLAPSAQALIEDRDRVGEFVFTTTGSTAFSGFSRGKARLDHRIGFSDWTLHDLRRTFVTRLNEMGVPPHVVEACVNHISGIAKAGVAGVYNKAEYMHERKVAMERWAMELDSIVSSGDVEASRLVVDND